MAISINNTASAMRAFSTKMAVSANNVANSLSDEFKKSQAVITEGENNDSVDTNIRKVNTAGPLVEDPLNSEAELKELSNTEISEEMTNQISTQHSFEANAKVITAYDDTLGSLIDTLG